MSIKTRLVALLLLPLAAALLFGLQSFMQNWRVASEMSDVQELSDLSVHISSLVHETQKERGLTAGFLGSKGAKFGDKLTEQRKLADNRIAELRQFLSTFDTTHFDVDFQKKLKVALTSLDQIAAKRQAVSSQEIALGDALGYYTRMNGEFLNTIGTATKLSSDAELTVRIGAYVSFLKGKERAGIERAVLSNTFARDEFGPGMFKKFVSLVTQQETYAGEFALLAAGDDVAFFNKTMKAPCVDEVARYRQIASEKASTGGFNVEAAEWFATSTKRINLLKQVEDHLSTRLQDTAAATQTAASNQVLLLGFLNLVIAGLTAGGGYWVIRSILRPVQVVGGVLDQVTQGDLSKRVELKSSDEMGRMGVMLNQAIDSIMQGQKQTKEAAERETKQAQELKGKVDQMLDVLNVVGTGDYSKRVQAAGDDAIGKLGKGLQQFIDDKQQAEIDEKGRIAKERKAQEEEAAKERQLAEEKQRQAEELQGKVDAMLYVLTVVGIGDYSNRIEVTGDDAIGKLGKGLQKFIDDKQQAEIDEKERVEQERKAQEEEAAKERQLAQEKQRQAKELQNKVDQMLGVLEVVSTGDYSKRVQAAGDDAIGKLGKGLQQFIDDKQQTEIDEKKRVAQERKAQAEKAANERQQAEEKQRQAEELQNKVDQMLDVLNVVSTGDYSKRVEAAGNDAIGKLGKGLQQFIDDKLQAEIADQNRAVKERKAQDEEAAKERQQAQQQRQQAEDLQQKVNRMLQSLKRVSNRDYTEPVGVAGKDAIGQLGEGLQDFIDAKQQAEIEEFRRNEEKKRQAAQSQEEERQRAEQGRRQAAEDQQRARLLREKVDELLEVVAAASEGDLTKQIIVRGDEPIDELAAGLEKMLTDLRHVINDIADSAGQFSDGAKTIAGSSQSLAQGSQMQNASVEEMSASIEELTRSIDAVKINAAEANSVADNARQVAREGGQAVQQSVEAMNLIKGSSQQIGEIIKVISEIAAQTNLLALNAAIEAARAGSHGMGFAVVADEVRKLAERATGAAGEVTKLITESTRRVEVGAAMSEQTGQSLEKIIEGVDATAAKIAEIADATVEQSQNANGVVDAIQNISQVAEQSAAGSEHMAASSEQLEAQASSLRGIVSRFKTDEASSSPKLTRNAAANHDTSADEHMAATGA